jgi:hypothetical protein
MFALEQDSDRGVATDTNVLALTAPEVLNLTVSTTPEVVVMELIVAVLVEQNGDLTLASPLVILLREVQMVVVECSGLQILATNGTPHFPP